jgi:hypothetical protein
MLTFRQQKLVRRPSCIHQITTEKAFKQINVPEYHRVFFKTPSVPNFQQLMGAVNFTRGKELKNSKAIDDTLTQKETNQECFKLINKAVLNFWLKNSV